MKGAGHIRGEIHYVDVARTACLSDLHSGSKPGQGRFCGNFVHLEQYRESIRCSTSHVEWLFRLSSFEENHHYYDGDDAAACRPRSHRLAEYILRHSVDE